MMLRRAAWIPIAVLSMLTPGVARAGIGRHHLNQGPFGLPSLRVLEERLQLTHDQREQILLLYNQYRHRAHARHHLTTLSDKEGTPGSLRRELIAKIEAILTSTQRSLFQELLKHHGHRKPPGSNS